MPRMSKSHPMTGSLKKADGYRIAYFEWDPKRYAYFVKDRTAKKSYGPFENVVEAREKVEFYADGGRRAEKSTTAETPKTEETAVAAN